MKRSAWLWVAAGAAGAAIAFGRRERRRTLRGLIIEPQDERLPSAVPPALGGDLRVPVMPKELGMPIEIRGVQHVTPHGYFGAHRDGPPIHSHQGIDLQARAGSHVLAVGDGRIVATEPGLGKVVRKLQLNSPGSWELASIPVEAIVYADLGKPLVEPGDRVRKGDPVALVAPAGFVHFAVKTRHQGSEEFIDPKLAGFRYELPAGMKEVG